MTAISDTRYTATVGEGGWDVIDSTTGKCVGVSPSFDEARKAAQRLSALIGANETRFRRAAIKREVHGAASPASSRETCAAVLEDNPPALASMRLEALLRCVRHHHKPRQRDTLRYAACTDSKLIGDLTDRQRARLCEALRMDTESLRVAVMGPRP